MSPAWPAVGKYILSSFVKRKNTECKEGLQMAITCNEQRRQRWTNWLKKTKKKETKKKEGNIFLKKRSGLRIIIIIIIKKLELLSAGDITAAVRGSNDDVTVRTEAMIGCTCVAIRVLLRVMMDITYQDSLIFVQFRRRPTDITQAHCIIQYY